MRRLLVTLGLILAAAPAWATLSPLGGVKIGAVQAHPPAPARNPAIEKAIVRETRVPSGSEVAYTYSEVRLRDGRPPQVLVLLSGPYFCGTGGCTGLILEGAPSYRTVTSLSLMRGDWLVTRERHNGWRDIVCRVSGGGAVPHYARLRFNGRTYPDNPSTAPTVPAGSLLSGDLYLPEDDGALSPGPLRFTAP